MRLRPPECGNAATHTEHHFLQHGEARRCPGWTPEEAAITLMVDQVEAWAEANSSPPWPRVGLPKGAELEVHLALLNQILQMVDPFSISYGTEEPEPRLGNLPVTATTGLKPGEWRIVIVQQSGNALSEAEREALRQRVVKSSAVGLMQTLPHNPKPDVECR